MKASRRRACFKRDKWRCTKCGSFENLTVDHVVPKSLGGKDFLKNLQTLCASCNQQKANTVKQYSRHKRTADYVKKYLCIDNCSQGVVDG